MSGDYLDHFRARVLQDALNEAMAAYWLRRAEQFEAARPTLADFRGEASAAELGARWRELDEVARACRARAAVSPLSKISPEVMDALGVVA
ncbi:hypothetical protein [Nocardioides aquiterrae]|uniref:hypothetical protein n=1 Tax=Nocardioides aquiterrae TaxID=203799 RepID=UPI0031D7739F